MKEINEAIMCAGFGGQGVMVLGKFLANAGLEAGYNITYLPSYGVEVRGGTARSSVKISSSFIANPVINNPNVLIVMNDPSLEKFENKLVKDGLLIVNTSICTKSPQRKDIDIVEAALSDEAKDLGNIKVANIIAAAIYAEKKNIFSKEIMESVIRDMAGKKEDLIPINMKAIDRGIEIAKGN